MKKSELVEQLRRSRRELNEALAGLSEEHYLRPKAVGGGTLQNLLQHLAAWDEEMLRVLQAFTLPEEAKFSYAISPENDFAVWNAEQLAKRQGQTMADTLREFEMARRDLLQTVDSLTEPVLRRQRTTTWGSLTSGYGLVQTQVEHEEEHTRQVLSWRKKMDRWKRARAKLSERRKLKKA